MPHINKDFLLKLDSKYQNYDTFIETGTYYGKTIFEMEKYFNKLYTIEIKKEFYESTKNKYKGNKIDFILGDSSEIFKNLLPKINEDTIFFLDGHWSSGNTGRGKKDCPLIEEVNLINLLFKKNAILIIDDIRLFGKGPNKKNEVCNWEDISEKKIIDILKNRITNKYYLDSKYAKNDRLILHIKSI